MYYWRFSGKLGRLYGPSRIIHKTTEITTRPAAGTNIDSHVFVPASRLPTGASCLRTSGNATVN